MYHWISTRSKKHLFCASLVYTLFASVIVQAMERGEDKTHPLILDLKRANENALEEIAWSRNEAYIAAFSPNSSTCKVWNTSTKSLHTLEASNYITAFAWGQDSMLALGLNDGTVEIWDVSTHSLKIRMPGNVRISLLAWSHKGSYLAVLAKNFTGGVENPYTNESTITIWDANSRLQVASVVCDKHVSLLQWAPFEDYLAVGLREVSGTAHKVQVFSIVPQNTEVLCSLLREYNESDELYSLVWCPRKNQLAVSLSNGTIAVYDNDTGLCINRWQSSELGRIVGQISWSRDGNYLISGGIDKIQLWKTLSGDITGEVSSLKNLDAFILSLSPNFDASDKPFAVEKIAWAPYSPLIAAGIKSQYKGIYTHILIVFDVHSLYASFKALQRRERTSSLTRSENSLTVNNSSK